jgi:membrane protein implicated in regulation of membrane protease activity
MTWADFYLTCFLAGFLMSAVSLVTGSGHLHLPHLHLSVHVPHVHVPHVHIPHVGGQQVPLINLGTLAAFLTWFGGTGFLLVRLSSLWTFFALGIALVSGLVGAGIIFLFLAKVLMRNETEFDPEDSDMVGVLGALSVSIREGGTGEIVFTQGGTRHCMAARSEDGSAVAKNTEVVVTRFEKGVAYVRRWEELAGEPEDEAHKN